MTKLNSFADLAGTELAAQSQLYVNATECVRRTVTIANAARMLADIFERANPWAREMIKRENIERHALEYVRKVANDMNNQVRSSAPKRVEDRGQAHIANGHDDGVPSSPQSKTSHGTAGQRFCAKNGQSNPAQPSREPVDGVGGHRNGAKSQERFAPSPSPKSSLLGHNKPPKEKTGPAFDPAKLIEATADNKKQVAIWYLSDGKVPYKLALSECLVRSKDGVDCRILVEACMAKYANALVDMSKTPEELLTSEEIAACQEKAKRLRATALEAAA